MLINDDTVNVTSRTANEYTHPKNKNSKDVSSSKMRASTELDNLLSISEYSHSNADDGRHNIAKDSWEYYKTLFNIDGNYFTGILNIGKNGNQKTLYDINNIKKTTQNGKLDNSSVILNKSSFSNKNIPQNTNEVKLPAKLLYARY